ncbi:MAG: hypothetical protein WCY82_09280, partial [Desulfotomaculaceae bacterium]
AGGKPLVVNGVSGQTANLTEWNDGNGNVTVVDEDGRIGIGTNNPSHSLDVNGEARISTLGAGATDTVVTHNAGVLQSRSIDSRVWGSTLVDGSSLTANYLTKVSDANTIVNSLVFDDGTGVGIGTTSPTALLHLGAGTSSLAPLKLTAGTNLTTPQTGALEYDGSELYFTPVGTTRETIAYLSDITAVAHDPITLAVIGSTPNAYGMTLNDQILNLEPASIDYGGVVTTGAQTFAGAKTFASAISAPTTVNTINGLIINAGALSGISTLSMSGQLTSTLATGTAPFVIASTTLVTNLNADLLDGYHYDELPYVPAGTDDWVDEAGDTMTGTLNFSGVTNDITTAGNEHLALMPGGTGNVGIGTSSPGYKLDVSGDINLSTALRAGGDAGTNGYLLTSGGGGVMTWTDPASLAAGTIAFNNITSGTNTVAAMVVGSGASLTYSGSGTINASTLAGQAISALPYVNDATNATLTRTGSGPYTLGLNLANANTWTGAQTFSANTNFPGSGIWNTSGDVGIGTTSPSGKLHIAGLSELDGSAPITFIINDTRNSNGWTVGAPFGQINFNSNDSSGGGVGTRARVAAVMENDQGGITGLAFSTAGTGGLVERMRINNLGNVGIGTTNPVSKLQVGNPSVHETHDVNFYGGYNLYFDDGWDARFFWHGAKGALRVGNKGDGSGWDPANIGDYSIALGTGGTASGDKSIAIGSVVNASGDRSIALGGFVTVSGTRSVGIGLDTTPRTISQDNTMAILGGSVGIGTTSPTYLLDVSGGSGIVGRFSGRVIGANAVNNDEFVTKLQLDNATASSLPAGTSGQTLRHNGTAWIANSFLYNSGTNIGIGTSSPAAMLDVVGWSDNLSALFGNNTTNNFNKQTYIGSRHYTNAEEPINIIGVVSGSSTSNLRIGGGTSNLNAATEIRLYTAANTTTTTGTARMTIHSNGNIGIGFTTAPAARLDVVGESNDITALFGNVTSLNSSKFANIGLRHYAGSTEEPLGLIAATSSNSINNVFIGGGASVLNAATQIQFYTAANTTTTTGTARMTITSAGLVGIGTTSPGSKLTVHNQGAAATGEALLRLNQYEAQDFIAGHYNGATDASFRVNNSGNVYSTTFYAITDPTYFLSPTGPTSLTTIGDVGIGTNSPSARLEVVGAFGTSTTGLKIY